MEQLCDDVLELIFDFLTDYAKVKLSRTCKRMASIKKVFYGRYNYGRIKRVISKYKFPNVHYIWSGVEKIPLGVQKVLTLSHNIAKKSKLIETGSFKKLEIIWNYVVPVDNICIPPTLEHLSIKLALGELRISAIPKTIKSLEIVANFASIIEDDVINKDIDFRFVCKPGYVNALYYHKGHIPKGVKSLAIVVTGSMPLEDIVPETVTSLEIHGLCLTLYVLNSGYMIPASVKKLYLPKDLKVDLSKLSNSVEFIKFGGNYNEKITCLPKSVKQIAVNINSYQSRFGMEFKESDLFPEGVYVQYYTGSNCDCDYCVL